MRVQQEEEGEEEEVVRLQLNVEIRYLQMKSQNFEFGDKDNPL